MRVGISKRLIFCAFNIPLLHAILASDFKRVIVNMSWKKGICIGTPIKEILLFAIYNTIVIVRSPFYPNNLSAPAYMRCSGALALPLACRRYL